MKETDQPIVVTINIRDATIAALELEPKVPLLTWLQGWDWTP
jgi:hypothetical protein